MTDCLFCKISSGDIKANVIFESNEVIAFHDIQPQAPVHILIIPKQHFSTLNEIDDVTLLGKLHQTAAQLAKQIGIDQEGYRIVVNCNTWGGQAVYHLHLHLLGGRQMNWPAG